VQMRLLYELGVLKAGDLESWTGEDLNTAIQSALATQSAESSPDTEQ
jgi:hypothetical protein